MIDLELVTYLTELYTFLKRNSSAKIKGFVMEEKQLDLLLVPLGMGILLGYHVWLIFTIIRTPKRTVIGLNVESRHKWIHCLMADPLKNGVLAVQTLRNNIMASTLLATTAITLSSLISVYVSNKSNSVSLTLVYGNKTPVMSSVKFFTILLCFLVAFLCNVQSIRYYAHVSFLATVPTSGGKKDAIEYVATNLNRGSFFWSLGLRAFYLSFPLFCGFLGPFQCFCVVVRWPLFFIFWILRRLSQGIYTLIRLKRMWSQLFTQLDLQTMGMSIMFKDVIWFLLSMYQFLRFGHSNKRAISGTLAFTYVNAYNV